MLYRRQVAQVYSTSGSVLHLLASSVHYEILDHVSGKSFLLYIRCFFRAY